MKKKAKARQSRPNIGRPADAGLVVRQAEAALARGEVDAACQLLAQARPLMGSLDRELGAKAFVSQAYARWDRPARALDSLERALEWTPGSAELHRLRGHLFRRLGRLKLAGAEFMEAQRLAPGNEQVAFETLLVRLASGEATKDSPPLTAALAGPVARLAAALIAVLRHDPAAAVTAISRPEGAVEQLLEAVCLLSRGQVAGAAPALEELAAREELPGAVQAYVWFYLGVARAQRRELKQAGEAFDRAAALGAPEELVRAHRGWVFQQLARDAVHADDLVAAAGWFERLAELGGAEAATARDNAFHALSLLGQRRARGEDYAGAVEAWSQAIALSPRNAPLRQNLAIALERAGRREEAIPHWQELVRHSSIGRTPKTEGAGRGRSDRQGGDEDDLHAHIRVTAHRHLAELFTEQDEPGRAVEQLERALRVLPQDVDTHRDLGRLLLDEGEVGKAIPHFEQVVEACPNSADDHLELGLAQLTVGKESSGVEHLERALSLEPEQPFARFVLGTALAQRVLSSPGVATALDDARRAMELVAAKGSIVGLLAYAAAQLARGDGRGAKKTFKQVEKETTDKLPTILAIGNVYWQAGDKEAALAAWTKVTGKAKRNPCLYAQLAEAWAQAGDAGRCEECLMASLEHSEAEAIVAIKRIAGSPERQPFLREVLHKLIPATDDMVARVYLAEGLIHAGDVPGARSTLRGAVRQAMDEEDYEAIGDAVDLDYRYNNTLLDRKTAGTILDWADVGSLLSGRKGIGGAG